METAQGKQLEKFVMIGNWDLQVKQLRQQFPELSDADVKYETGGENVLLSRIGKKIHKRREDVIILIQRCQVSTVLVK